MIEDKGFAVVMIADVDMTRSSNLIDFRELVSAVPGEGLEELVRHIGHKKNLLPNFSGRGADGGRDLFFTETLVGEISIQKLKWLVSCKDKALSGEAVAESDLPAIKDKTDQHHADGFLLVTTTIPGTGLKEKLDSFDRGRGGKIYTRVWDKSELTKTLLQPEYHVSYNSVFPKAISV